jgi:hypothetical protein
VLTINETHIVNEKLVNEARVGYNRINISFDPNVVVNPADLGMNIGITQPLALPQITIQGLNLNFGGPAGFPQGRTVVTFAAADTATYLYGAHVFKVGGEYRRTNQQSFTLDPGTFMFGSVAAFQSGLGNSFVTTLGDRSFDLTINTFGGFIQDSWSLGPNLKLDLGLRYDFIGSPSEANDKLVVFDADTVSLVQLGSGIDQIHKNTSDFQPRIGAIWSPTGNGRLTVRGAYAVMTNQTNTGYVSGSASNPPLATPLTVSGNVRLDSALTTAAAGGLAPTTTSPDFLQGRLQTWNVNVQQELAGTGVMVGYFGSHGDRQRIPVNINQFINGVRPYPRLSPTSPISPGAIIGNITEVQSTGWSDYKGLWLTANRPISRGVQFSASYTLSKSTDTNSYEGSGANNGTPTNSNGALQNSYDLKGSEGPSDFDVRHRFSINGTYELPFHGNQFVEGWQITGVFQGQSGSPINVLTNINQFTGVTSLRPDLVGDPNIVGDVNQWFANSVCDPRTAGSCTSSSVFALPVSADGVFHMGNLPRNAIIGPGFTNVDLSVIKNIELPGTARVQLRVETFNLFNRANLGQPSRIATVGSTSFGVITNTRFPTGDSGSARQIQFAAKFLF